MSTKCKFCCLLIFVLAIILAFTIFAAVAYFSNSGDSETLFPMDVRILKGGISSTWCEGQIIKSVDNAPFDACVVPGTPKIDPRLRVKTEFDMESIPLAANDEVHWRFYLPRTSVIDVMQCASATEVMSYIFEGKEVDDGCVTVTLKDNHYKRYAVENNRVCTNITLNRLKVRICRQAKQSMRNYLINDDFYIILYKNNGPETSYVTSEIHLDQPTFDLSNSFQNCSNQVQCTLPLRYNSDDTVVAKLLTDPKSGPTTLKWTCKPRWIQYLVVIGVIPVSVVIIVLVIWFIVSCRSKRRKKAEQQPVENRPPITVPPEVKCEKEPLLTDRRYHSYESFDDVDHTLARMGPIPGPVYPNPNLPTDPSAPPEVQDEPGEGQPFLEPTLQQVGAQAEFQPIYPEPPPTYEETMRTEDDSQQRERRERRNEERRPQKC